MLFPVIEWFPLPPTPLQREVLPARSWFLEITAIWAAIGTLAYTGFSVL